MPRKHTYRPSLEVLEDRWVPSTFTVTNLRDNGLEEPPIAGSLRRAVDRANGHVGRDTIVFKPGLQGTIKLRLGEMLISDSLVLAGPGAARIKIDGNDLGRIFTVSDSLPDGNAETVRKVTLSGLTLFNGRADFGGAIVNAGERLTLRGMVIRNNSAFAGGGILSAGPLHIQRSRIVANQCDAGGGGLFATFDSSLYPVEPPVVIVNSKINGNQANQGGGIYLDGSILTINSSTVANNSARTDGGGLYARTSVIINASTIRGNLALGIGGGIAISNGVVSRIVRTRIVENVAGDGGGVASEDSTFSMKACTIRLNRGDILGGGILVNGGMPGDVSLIVNTTIVDNNAGVAGAGVRGENAAVRFRNSTISHNRTPSLPSSKGGGLSLFGSAVVVSNCTLALNRADGGHGIAAEASAITLLNTICVQPPGHAGAAIVGNDIALTASFSLVSSRELLGASSVTVDPISDLLYGKDPRLAPLANNGGPTQTHALRARSPAINKGTNAEHLATDQRGRGFKRKVGAGVDIGAFERQ